MRTEPLITTYLEMRSRDQLRPKRSDTRFQVRERTERDWRFNRDLYLQVGDQWDWVDKRSWADDQWKEYATAPSCGHLPHTVMTFSLAITNSFRTRKVESRSLTLDCCLNGSAEGWVARLLTSAIEEAWSMEPKPSRVWVHTCNRDHPQALANYQARGMIVYKVEEEL